MQNYSNFAIVASFVGLWITSFFTSVIQIYVGFILIFSFGLLHGANDLALIKNVNDAKHKHHSLTLLAYYIGVVIAGALFFYFIPWLALALFILVSGYHFGEQQWKEQLGTESNLVKFWYRLLYGLLVLSLLFALHKDETSKIIFAITLLHLPLSSFALLLKIIFVPLLLLTAFLFVRQESFRKQCLPELFYLSVFAVIFKVSSLIWGFALYFIFWHSIPSIMDQILFLFGKVNFNNFKLYFRSAFIYWIGSLAGISILYFLLRDQEIFNALFFSFLASITFPHVLVVKKMFGKNTKNTK